MQTGLVKGAVWGSEHDMGQTTRDCIRHLVQPVHFTDWKNWGKWKKKIRKV